MSNRKDNMRIDRIITRAGTIVLALVFQLVICFIQAVPRTRLM